MPGSLFPRSASMMPESPPLPAVRGTPVGTHPRTDLQVVKEEPFPRGRTSKPTSSHSPRNKAPLTNGKLGADDDSVRMPPPAELPSRLRKGSLSDSRSSRERDTPQSRRSVDGEPVGGTAVREAVGRFAEDADASLMLPSPQRTWKGKEKEIIYARSETSATPSGKEKENSQYLDEMNVRGKEQELRAVRAASVLNEHSQDEEERRRDKERIRQLESEIAWLKAQVRNTFSRLI